MADRKDEILRVLVEEYIGTANPVSSSLVVEKHFQDLSSATVRNEMADLEEMGLIYQPYTSAGRIPTAAGYQKYLQIAAVSDSGQVSDKGRQAVDTVAGISGEQDVKALAKAIAEACDGAVLIGFSPLDVYYTGISNLFRQPEFREQSAAFSISEIIDHLDDVMSRIFHNIDGELEILLGDNNPFGALTSVVTTKCSAGGKEFLLGILGPNRMDYKANVGLIRYAQEKFNNK